MTNSPTPRLRVLRVTTTIEPEMGGPSHTMVAAAIAEQRARVDVTVASTVGHAASARSSVGPARAEMQSAGVAVRVFVRPSWAGDWAQRWGYSARFLMWLIVRARRYDVVHVDYVWSLSTVAALLGARAARRPTVMTPHESLTGFDASDSRSWRRRVQKRAVRRLMLSHIDVIVVASEIERRDSNLGSPQARVIPHPVAEPVSARGPVPAEPRTVGFLGRLHPKKRVPLLLEAMELVPPEVRLRIGGGHPAEELARLRDEVADGPLSSRVELLGFVHPDERAAFFESIDLLAMPSDYECFGMVAAEAMAAGLPVVVSDRTGVASLVEEFEAGVVVPTDDAVALAAAVESLTSDEAATRAASLGALRCVAERLTSTAYADAMKAIYEVARSRSDAR